jgi:hypothetical protein
MNPIAQFDRIRALLPAQIAKDSFKLQSLATAISETSAK